MNYGPITPTEEFRACLSSPCQNSTMCVDLPGATYACRCPEDYTGPLCDIRIGDYYEVPSFTGKSFVRMKRLQAYYSLNIELEFVTYADNGIILYDQQNLNGSGDFVSLAIIDG